MTDEVKTPEKSRLAAFMLGLFLGNLGIHRFYLGHTGTAIAQLIMTLVVITAPIATIWALIDVIMIIGGSFKDAEGRIVTKW